VKRKANYPRSAAEWDLTLAKNERSDMGLDSTPRHFVIPDLIGNPEHLNNRTVTDYFFVIHFIL
jgi:hypothetical protein